MAPYPIATLRDVTYRYPGALGNFQIGPLNLRIEAGKLIFWLGLNGSGKSTLARVLAGEITDYSGTIDLAPDSVIYHDQALSANIFSSLTIADHFRLLAKGAEDLNLVKHRFPELSKLRSRYPDELSGGQIQAVAFASTMLASRRLYILDEVFNHLDSKIASRIIDTVVSYMVTPTSSAIVITHNLLMAVRYAQLIQIFSEGNLTAQISDPKTTSAEAIAGLLSAD